MDANRGTSGKDCRRLNIKHSLINGPTVLVFQVQHRETESTHTHMGTHTVKCYLENETHTQTGIRDTFQKLLHDSYMCIHFGKLSHCLAFPEAQGFSLRSSSPANIRFFFTDFPSLAEWPSIDVLNGWYRFLNGFRVIL